MQRSRCLVRLTRAYLQHEKTLCQTLSSSTWTRGEVLYRTATASDVEPMLDLMHRFYHPDEPMRKTLGIFKDSHRRIKAIDDYYDSLIQQGLSLVATDAKTGEILGHMINKEYVDNHPKYVSYCSSVCSALPAFMHIVSVFEQLHANEPKDLWTALAEGKDGKRFFSLNFGVVTTAGRGKSVATGLAKASTELAKGMGFAAAVSEATGTYSLRSLQSCGFSVVAEFLYSDYRHEGVNVFASMPKEHPKCSFLVKKL